MGKIRQFVLSSNNAHKLEEFQALFDPYNIRILSLKDINIRLNVDETGQTFLENSKLKTTALKILTDLPVIADDSGIVVPALNGEPGIYSARYAGVNASDEENRHKLLAEIKTQKLLNPNAFYVCALTYEDSDTMIQVEGYCHGNISNEEKGLNGFGYDPIFFLPQFKKTAAEISSEMKNKISHRNDAIRQLIQQLKSSNII